MAGRRRCGWMLLKAILFDSVALSNNLITAETEVSEAQVMDDSLKINDRPATMRMNIAENYCLSLSDAFGWIG